MSWIHPLHAYVEPPLDHRASKDADEHPSREQCLPPQALFQDQEVLPRAAWVPPPRRCPRCSSGRRGTGFLLAGLVMVGLLVKEVSVRLVWWRGLLLCFQVSWRPAGCRWRSDVKKVEGGIWTPFSGCTCSRSPESSLLLAFKGSKAMVNPCKSWKDQGSQYLEYKYATLFLLFHHLLSRGKTVPQSLSFSKKSSGRVLKCLWTTRLLS